MTVQVAERDAREIAAIMPIMESAFHPEYGEAWTAAQCLSLLATPGTSLITAEMGGVVTGFALTRWVFDEEELLMIGVAPEFQRMGIAGNLAARIIARAKASNRKRIFLEVRSNNPARHFYLQLGFADCGVRKAYYRGSNGNRFDATTMALDL
ncbi:MAG: ribosomal protein S18-alanine N-acetyltransferase [Sphingomonadales bacterium]|jgi:ribosomal-protein-alanine N-acetyltransferase|nr:ribosomal protein S18-alanine N-acetyltransferase [Sphingomonadales bacterium]MBK9003068.1 ribosomal protein S18-alanine N-acetyltransferase [Sphingomonadales bacterium]MBK9268316.1 ribosomal protein S18-alanine N-acetyltransferase [Sphingomonadales bacterium]MBP6435441.1 ribosomal protein S18-alanine N-acetyltransferase [Sphingorhabdus sp.]